MTGLEIEHWLSIDFDGFRDMVDAVGGVTIDNPVAFSYTNNGASHQAGDWSLGTFPAGEIHLDGERRPWPTRGPASRAFRRNRPTSRAPSGRRGSSRRCARSSVTAASALSCPGLRVMDAMEGRDPDRPFGDRPLLLLAPNLSSDRRVDVSDGTILSRRRTRIGQYILIPRDWTGPGAYDGFRAFLADELAQADSDAVAVAPADAP